MALHAEEFCHKCTYVHWYVLVDIGYSIYLLEESVQLGLPGSELFPLTFDRHC